MIPDITYFREILDSLSLTSNELASKAMTLSPARIAVDESSQLRTGYIELTPLFYAEKNQKALDALLKKLGESLSAQGHTVSEETAKLVLSIAAHHTNGEMTIHSLNNFLSTIRMADVSQFWIFRFAVPHNWSQARITPFTVGEINRQKLIYWCKRIKCDFFDLYPNQFRNSLSIERDRKKIAIFDIKNIFSNISRGNSEKLRLLLDEYFSDITTVLRTLFISEFDEIQSVLVAAGAPGLDLSNPILNNEAGFLALYQNISEANDGYLSPKLQGAAVNFNRFDRKAPAIQKALSDEFDFNGFRNTDLDFLLRSFCSIILRSKIFQSTQAIDEAFLYKVIALELALGGNSPSTEISTRGAALFAGENGLDYRSEVKIIRDIYDARSRFVHDGKALPKDYLIHLDEINRVVLRSLLRLRRNMQEYSKENWHMHLDLAASNLKVDRVIDDDLRASIGLKSQFC